MGRSRLDLRMRLMPTLVALIAAVALCALIYVVSGGHVLFLGLPLLFAPMFFLRRR
jgi:hypothetical protein